MPEVERIFWMLNDLRSKPEFDSGGFIRVGDKRYASFRVCAKHLGVNVSVLRRAWQRALPSVDQVGLVFSENRREVDYLRWKHARFMPFDQMATLLKQHLRTRWQRDSSPEVRYVRSVGPMITIVGRQHRTGQC
jgi:hypothetical protein